MRMAPARTNRTPVIYGAQSVLIRESASDGVHDHFAPGKNPIELPARSAVCDRRARGKSLVSESILAPAALDLEHDVNRANAIPEHYTPGGCASRPQPGNTGQFRVTLIADQWDRRAYPRAMKSNRRGSVTAAEVVAEKERRLREDPEYRREAERVEAEVTERAQQLRAAEQPVLDDLARVGVELETIWNLYEVPEFHERAVPVLLRHLVLDYPDSVLMGIGQRLADRSTRP
jgi:hypothetical protein